MVKPKQDHNRQKKLHHVKAPHSGDSEDNPSCTKPISHQLIPITFDPPAPSCL